MNDPEFKILSIDFNFFPDVTKNELIYYPDGVDVSTEMSEIIWATHYITNGNKIKQININKKLYNNIVSIIENQSINTPVLITNSHIHAFDFIETYFNNKKIILTNIDWHHDMINDNPKMDCDNWMPPHLDKYFDDLLKNCFSIFPNAKIEKCVIKPRNIGTIKKYHI